MDKLGGLHLEYYYQKQRGLISLTNWLSAVENLFWHLVEQRQVLKRLTKLTFSIGINNPKVFFQTFNWEIESFLSKVDVDWILHQRLAKVVSWNFYENIMSRLLKIFFILNGIQKIGYKILMQFHPFLGERTHRDT